MKVVRSRGKTGKPGKHDAANDNKKNDKHGVQQPAIGVFGCKTHIAVDRGFGFIRSYEATDAAKHDGAVLRWLVSRDNTSPEVWADTAHRSNDNEKWPERNGCVSRIHRKTPPGRPMPDDVRKENAAKSKIRVRVEHVFADRKAPPAGLCIRTIGLDRAAARIGLGNITYNIRRYPFHERRRRRGDESA